MTAKNLLFKNSRPLKYFIFSLTCVVIAVMFTSCEQNPTAPTEPPKPPGYQEDIYWPSLADSPWPKYRHDPQNTGRSLYPGPKEGVINWEIDSLYLLSELILGDEDNLLTVTGWGYLYNFNLSGMMNWKSNFSGIGVGHITTSPLITASGNIIVADNSTVYSLTNTGDLNWSFFTNSQIFITGLNIDIEGNIYLTDDKGTLYSLDKNGNLNWTYFDNRFYSNEEVGIAFSPDGKTLYLPGWDTSLFAFNITDRKIKWSIDKGTVRSSPLVDSQGNIYIITSRDQQDTLFFYSITSEGQERFSYQFTSSWGNYWRVDPTIDKNGNLFFAGDTLYSLDYSGNLRWKLDLTDYNISPIVNDAQGNIYIITQQLFTGEHTLLSVNNNGITNWEIQFYFLDIPGYSPIIGSNNSLFMNVLNIDAIQHPENVAIYSIK